MNSFMDKVFKEVDNKELCNSVKYSSYLHNTLLQYVINLQKVETKDLTDSTFEIIMILNRLSFYHFCKVMKDIDSIYPGISFHFIMEVKQRLKVNQKIISEKVEVMNLTRYQNVVYLNPEVTDSIDNNNLPFKEAQNFFDRLYFLKDINCLGQIFAPMRVRLINGILDENDSPVVPISPEKIALHNYFNWISKDSNISNDFKSATEDIIHMYLARNVLDNYQPAQPTQWTEEQFISVLKNSKIYNAVQD